MFTEILGWTPILQQHPDWGPLRVGVEFEADSHREIAVTAPLTLPFHPSQAERAEQFLAARLGYPCDFEWDWSGRRFNCPTLIVRPAETVPAVVDWDGTAPPSWDLVTVGETADGPVVWDLRRAPHMLVCGRTRSGKSTTMEAVARQWQTAGGLLAFVDPKMVEFSPWQGQRGVLQVVIGLPETANLLNALQAEQSARYAHMVAAGTNHWTKLDDPPQPLLLAVDECGGLLRQTKPAAVHKHPNALRASVSHVLLDIAERGAAAGMHLLLACQRTEADWFVGSLKLQCGARVLVGHTDLVNWQMMFGSVPYPAEWAKADGQPIEVPPGRGHVYLNGDVREVQLLRAA